MVKSKVSEKRFIIKLPYLPKLSPTVQRLEELERSPLPEPKFYDLSSPITAKDNFLDADLNYMPDHCWFTQCADLNYMPQTKSIECVDIWSVQFHCSINGANVWEKRNMSGSMKFDLLDFEEEEANVGEKRKRSASVAIDLLAVEDEANAETHQENAETDEANVETDEENVETDDEDRYQPPKEICSKKKRGKRRAKRRKVESKNIRKPKQERDQYMRFDKTYHRTVQDKRWMCMDKTKRGVYLASHENQLIACLLADDQAGKGWDRKFNTHNTPMIDRSAFDLKEFRSNMKLVTTNNFWSADKELWAQNLFLWKEKREIEDLKRLSFLNCDAEIPTPSILVGYCMEKNGQSEWKAILFSKGREKKRRRKSGDFQWWDHHVAPFKEFKNATNHVWPAEAMNEILTGNFDRISLRFISMTKRALKESMKKESMKTNKDSSKILEDALRKKLKEQKELQKRKLNGDAPWNSPYIVRNF